MTRDRGLPFRAAARGRSWRAAVASVALIGTTVATLAAATPASARPRPVSWGTRSINPYAADAASARSYNATWGWYHASQQLSVAVSEVVPPRPVTDLTTPTDATSVLLRKTMNRSLKYALTTWWKQRFGSQATATLLNLGGIDEYHVRGPAMEAYALAIALHTGNYLPSVTGVSTAVARADAVKLVAALAKHHAANSPSGWGRVWQSPLWAAMAGTAGWLLWDDLDTATRTAVMRMVENEAGALTNYPVPYYQDVDGTVLTPGDTKAEEDSWDAMILQLALAMMPTHPLATAWAQKNVELMLAAFSRQQDLTDDTVFSGRPLRDWLHGSNINADGTVVNHGIIHPDYMATVIQNLTAPVLDAQAGEPAPEAALHDADVVYGALTTRTFDAPPFRDPGGTIYVPDSAALYYPQSDDWGTSRIAHMVALDEMAVDMQLDDHAAVPAATELDLHLQQVAAMQARGKDGRSYQTPEEDTYNLREEWVAYHLSLAWLCRWTASNGLLAFTNVSVFPTG